MFHRKLGSTPRFVEQASAVLATTDPDRLREQLEGVAETSDGAEGDELRELQQRYFADLFLPQLYEALPPPYRLGLSRLALLDVPIPLDGVASVAGLGATDARDAASQWLSLGLVQRFVEPDEVPLFGVYPLQREFLTHPGRLPEAPARAAHGAAAAFFHECFEKDREEELRLPIAVELLACMRHAHAAGDTERRRWAAILLSRRMQRRAEFQAALELLEPLLEYDCHPSLLVATANAFGSLGEWKEARRRYTEALAMLKTSGDRAGEAATWHQLATIDLREGNHAAARERFGKSLAIFQAIGDRASEAATFYQIGCMRANDRKGTSGSGWSRSVLPFNRQSVPVA